MRRSRRGGHHGPEFGGSGEDSFVAVVVTKLTGALLFILLAVWRVRFRRRDQAPSLAYLCTTLLTVLALVYQGSLGGAMVFGR